MPEQKKKNKTKEDAHFVARISRSRCEHPRVFIQDEEQFYVSVTSVTSVTFDVNLALSSHSRQAKRFLIDFPLKVAPGLESCDVQLG